MFGTSLHIMSVLQPNVNSLACQAPLPNQPTQLCKTHLHDLLDVTFAFYSSAITQKVLDHEFIYSFLQALLNPLRSVSIVAMRIP